MVMKRQKIKTLLCLITLIITMNCIPTMETAKIGRGMRFGGYFEYSKLKPQQFGTTAKDQNTDVAGLGLKISNGTCFGKRSNYAAELGLDLGMLFYPTIIGIAEYDNFSGKYAIHYYPQSSHLILTPKIFARFGAFQNTRTSFAVRVDLAGYNFASVGSVLSRRLKANEIYTGFKIYDRFVKTPEQIMFKDRYGEYFCLGIEIPTEKRFYKTSKIYHLLFEVGIINNLWYEDHPTYCISAGFIIK